MARPLRIQYPGAWYHVTCRGNERGPIYQDDKDKKRFLTTLEESVEAFHVEVHCYTLMSNHFHFLLKTTEANLIGPILVNNRACQAVQMVISNSPYSHKFPLIGESQSQEPMARTAMD